MKSPSEAVVVSAHGLVEAHQVTRQVDQLADRSSVRSSSAAISA